MGLAHEFDTLLDAAAMLVERPEIVFAFVGGGARVADIRRGAVERGLHAVQFHPWVSTAELSAGLTAGDAHVITMRDGIEGLLVPSKIYGVLAAGRPALYVGPQRSAVATILAEANSGASVACGQAAELATLIRRYADDPTLCAEHGHNARSAFDQKYDRPRALRKFVELVESCEDAV
jgi:glycosyltransferase involved in cell wall biosynthesis